jgi:ribosomal 50S subunit-associated protein YjgA (DUF615 family)
MSRRFPAIVTSCTGYTTAPPSIRLLRDLGLPETLSEAIRAARRIKSRAAGARQRQYIGKLMREIDLEPIRATLASRSERDAVETQLFKRAEGWRERLIAAPPSERAARGPHSVHRSHP